MKTDALGGRDTIRAVATTLFAMKGFAATSTREICQEAGVTKPVLYYHFGNKEHLYKEIIFDAFNDYIKELDRCASGEGSVTDRLKRVLATIFQFTMKCPDQAKLAFRMVFAPEEACPVVNLVELAEIDEKLIEKVVEQGIKRNELEGDPHQMSHALIGMVRFYMMSYLVTKQPNLDSVLASQIVDLLVRGFGKATDR